jgi:hypothetical protein
MQAQEMLADFVGEWAIADAIPPLRAYEDVEPRGFEWCCAATTPAQTLMIDRYLIFSAENSHLYRCQTYKSVMTLHAALLQKIIVYLKIQTESAVCAPLSQL